MIESRAVSGKCNYCLAIVEQGVGDVNFMHLLLDGDQLGGRYAGLDVLDEITSIRPRE